MSKLSNTQKYLDHFMFFIIILISFVLSYLFATALFSNVLFILSSKLFFNFIYISFILDVSIFMIIFINILVKLIPGIKMNNYPDIWFQLVIILVFASNYSIVYINKAIELDWNMRQFFEVGLGYLLIINYILISLAVLITSKTLFDPKISTRSIHYRIVDIALLEIFIIILVLFVTIQVAFFGVSIDGGIVVFNLDFFDFTPSIKVLLVMLFALATQPSKID